MKRKAGRPKLGNEKVGLAINKSVAAAARRAAKSENRTISGYIERLIRINLGMQTE